MKSNGSQLRRLTLGEYSWKVAIARLIIIGIITLLACKLTTFGWQFHLKRQAKALPKDKALPERIKGHVFKLSAEIGNRSVFDYDKLEESAEYIVHEFSRIGYKVELQEFTANGRKVSNIIALKSGRQKAGEIIVIGAHYDTCFNPGADDNASAVAVLIELAKSAAGQNYKRTIEFVAFVNEEPPFYRTAEMGSLVYARKAKEERKDIKGAIILETIGYYSDKFCSQRYPLLLGLFYPNAGDFITVVGNYRLREYVGKVTKQLKKYCRFPVRSIALFDFITGVDFSDHWSFWQVGFPALMVSDTSFYRYPHYHKNSDTFEKLDYNKLAVLTEALEGALSDDL